MSNCWKDTDTCTHTHMHHFNSHYSRWTCVSLLPPWFFLPSVAIVILGMIWGKNSTARCPSRHRTADIAQWVLCFLHPLWLLNGEGCCSLLRCHANTSTWYTITWMQQKCFSEFIQTREWHGNGECGNTAVITAVITAGMGTVSR